MQQTTIERPAAQQAPRGRYNAAPARNERRDDRNDDRRRRWPGRPRRRPLSELDPPLPEDVAFRPVAEGGDRTLLPGRRRKPPGLQTTSRVVVAQPRHLAIFRSLGGPEPAPAPTRPAPEPPAVDRKNGHAPPAPHAPAAAPETDDDAPRRRRRGRRGGRGRRRDGPTGSPTATTDERVLAPETEAEAAVETEAETETVAAEAAPRAPRTPPRRAVPTAELPEAFRELGISEASLQEVASFGFTVPTPIQTEAIPLLLEGHDVVGVAHTGSGKTIAFGIPMLERIDPARAEVQALVLVPTRELAHQVLEVLTSLAELRGLRVVGLLGGRSLDRDFHALEGRPHAVVGTPGRVIDHLQRGTLSLSRVTFAVLDEADQMLDIGFLPAITRILGRTPRARQTALFSATMPMDVRRLIRRYMQEPRTIEIASENETVDSIEHLYFEVAQRDKVAGLRELIDRELRGRTLVFSRTKRGVDFLADRLGGLGVRVGALHGDMPQRQRDREVQRFRDGELDILIATNVAARGLDIPEITHVVNYDVPQNAEEYVHRTGRTGRAGRHGKAITLVSEHDMRDFDVLLRVFGERLRHERLDLYAPGEAS